MTIARTTTKTANRWLTAACLLLTGLLGANGADARELRVAYASGVATLDIQERLSESALQLAHLSFDPLVRWTRELEFEPRLATAYERIDNTRLRFRLRKDVRFHSGNPMTAKDFDFSFSRLKTSRDYRAIFDRFSALEVIDDYTIDLISDGPYPLALHAATHLFPLDSAFYSGTDDNGNDKSTLLKNGDSFASANLSGTGPFRVTAYDKGTRIEFERFPDYWDKGSPGNVSRIALTPIVDEQSRVNALINGEVDAIAPVSPQAFARIEGNDSTRLVTLTGARIIMFQMNQARREEFRDQRVRMAIVHAIDNERIVREIMGGFATTAAQLSPPGYSGHNPTLKPRYDLALARKLMRDAGHRNGFKISMMAPEGRYVNDDKIARAVAEMLADINVEVELQIMPKAQYWPLFDQRAADMMMLGWHSDTEDSANLFEYLAMTPDAASGIGAYNSGNYSSEYVDSQTRQAGLETDLDERAKILQTVEARIFQDAGLVPLHWQSLAWAVRRGVELDAVVNPLSLPYLGDLVIR